MSKQSTSSFLQDTTKAMYQPWRNEAFLADEFVQGLNYIQKWAYRTLLQSAFTCSTRPSLPDDDSRLWAMAGCESRKMWDEHKDAVRAMFTPTDNDGQKLLSQKKLLEDWERMQEARQARHDAAILGGRASAAKRWGNRADNESLADGQRTDNGTLTEGQRSLTNERNVTNQPTKDPSEGGEVGSEQGATGTAKTKGWLTYEDLQAKWTQMDAAPLALPRHGIEELREVTKNLSTGDILDTFERWFDDRYQPSYDTARIQSPLVMFARDFSNYRPTVEVSR